MSDKFTGLLLTPEEYEMLREVYAETYPVRPLLNAIDALAAQVAQSAAREAALVAERDSLLAQVRKQIQRDEYVTSRIAELEKHVALLVNAQVLR